VLDNRPGYVRGTDQWYMPVEFPGDSTDLGHFVRCQAESATRQGVTAVRISG
jgi:threonylcarbamoyladenosine tRNA methylthiotransferase MtaB